MELLFTPEFWSALLAIIVIDLVLAGDNAIVIGMAARNLPEHQQKKAIIWGTVGAIVIRALATLAVVWLLRIPGLLLVGGLILIWISLKLLVQDESKRFTRLSNLDDHRRGYGHGSGQCDRGRRCSSWRLFACRDRLDHQRSDHGVGKYNDS